MSFQLLSSLARCEGNATKNILCKIAASYPQALYYTVRAFLIERRELRPSHQSGVQNQNEAQRQQSQIRSTGIFIIIFH